MMRNKPPYTKKNEMRIFRLLSKKLLPEYKFTAIKPNGEQTFSANVKTPDGVCHKDIVITCDICAEYMKFTAFVPEADFRRLYIGNDNLHRLTYLIRHGLSYQIKEFMRDFKEEDYENGK